MAELLENQEPDTFQEIQSPPDDRDWQAEAIFPRERGFFPRSLDLRNRLQPPRNQGRRGSCAAFTAAAIKEYHETVDYGFTGYMSPEFVYFFREGKPEGGMHGRNVMKILCKKGCCYESDLSYQKEDVEYIPEPVIERALKNRIKSYARVHTIHGLKKALYKNGPCYISFPVYKNRPEIWRAEQGEKAHGGHAMTICGWNSKGFIIRNSWGSKWNGDGTVLYKFSEWGSHWEVWSLIDDNSSQSDSTLGCNIFKLLCGKVE